MLSLRVANFAGVPLINGIEVHYEIRGVSESPRTIFLNGSGATLARTGVLIDIFAESLYVACHDQRGLGLTSKPPGPYTMAEYTADALSLADHLGWSTFRLMGISFGGMVAQEVAVTAPERIERLALMCTSPGGAGGSSFPLHELASLEPEQRAVTYRTLLDTRFTDEWLEDHPNDRALLELMLSSASTPKSAEIMRGEREQLGARQGHDVWDRLERITCPALVAAGRFDGIAPLDNSEAITSRIQNSELCVFEGGHTFFLQDPLAIPAIRTFLAT